MSASTGTRPEDPVHVNTTEWGSYTEAGGLVVQTGNQTGLELSPSIVARVRGDRPPTRAETQQAHQACGLLRKHQAEHRSGQLLNRQQAGQRPDAFTMDDRAGINSPLELMRGHANRPEDPVHINKTGGEWGAMNSSRR